MKKFVCILAILLTTTQAMAASKSNARIEDNTGIVTPYIALGSFRVSDDYVTFNTAGEMVICDNYCNKAKKFTPFKDMIPIGRTYVGYKVSSCGYSDHCYDIFWK
jgi:hypothetical protein